MKKGLKSILVSSVFAFALLLTGCDKSGSLKKTYEKNDYSVNATTISEVYSAPLIGGVIKAAVEKDLTDEQAKQLSKYELVICRNGSDYALFVKFPSSSDLKAFLTTEDENGKKDTSAYDDAKNDGRINGNCLLLAGSSKAKELF